MIVRNIYLVCGYTISGDDTPNIDIKPVICSCQRVDVEGMTFFVTEIHEAIVHIENMVSTYDVFEKTFFQNTLMSLPERYPLKFRV